MVLIIRIGGRIMVPLEDVPQKKIVELTPERTYLIVKSNDLIQKARFTLSLQEQKIILYLISKIKPGDDDFIHQTFSVVDFCMNCGIDHDSGGNYKAIKDTIKALSDKSVWLTLESGTETLVRWINKAWINKNSGLIKMRLDDDMKPYLLQLSANFTQYELLYTLAMRSQYSVRLYELLKSYEYKHTWTFDIDELKRLLSAENYTLFGDFKRKVLDISMREINDLSDIVVSYEIIKEVRKFVKIKFTIKIKKDTDERIKTLVRIGKAIDPAQMSMFDKVLMTENENTEGDRE
jgi:plasmid replication initiation protein